MNSDFRVGSGSDFHELVPTLKSGRFLLGGVEISSSYQVRAHSDGDCLLHAFCDATLGALALGDMGHWFPDSDPQNKGKNSALFIKKVYAQAKQLGWELINADATIFLEYPKLQPYILSIRRSVAQLYQVELECINIKAKSFEGMWLDKGESIIFCQVVALFGRRR